MSARSEQGLDWLDPAAEWTFPGSLAPGRDSTMWAGAAAPPRVEPPRPPRPAGPGEPRARRPGSLFEDPIKPPPDPARDFAGTMPRHDPTKLLPASELVLPPVLRGDVVTGTAIEEDHEGRPLPGQAPRPTADGVEPPGPAPTLRGKAARRFHVAKGGLLALALCALVGAVLLVAAHEGGDDAPFWATWKPVLHDEDLPVPLQIGQHLGREYKLATGEQMVDVTSLGSLVIDNNLAGIAIRTPPSAGGDLAQLNPEKTTVYDMCGYGPDCQIATGEKSAARSLLLDREALEIALFTFKYTKADYAIVRYPSRDAVPTSKQVDQRIKAGLTRAKAEESTPVQTAQLFTRDALKPALDVPLDQTLTERTPSPVDVEQAPDSANVVAATADTQSQWSLIDSPQSGRTFLVLDLLAPSLPKTSSTP